MRSYRNSPSCFDNFFLLCSSVHQYCTRQVSKGNLYFVNRNTVQYGLKSLHYLGARLWNDITVEVRSICLENSFKMQLKIHLQNKTLLFLSDLHWNLKVLSILKIIDLFQYHTILTILTIPFIP